MSKLSPFILLILLISSFSYALRMPLVKDAIKAPMKTCSLFFNNNIVLHDIWLAETPKQRSKGLSGNNKADKGMIFTVPEAKKLSFWMKDTEVPLTIGFIDEQGVLFQIEDMLPQTKTAHTAKRKANRALELPKGQFQQYGLKVGSKLLNMQCKSKKFN